jgi:quercetin dioxygenase-like cupin family protein
VEEYGRIRRAQAVENQREDRCGSSTLFSVRNISSNDLLWEFSQWYNLKQGISPAKYHAGKQSPNEGITMTTTYTHILDLAKKAEPPVDGILSRTVFQDDRIKAVIFGFAQGQELSEHTAAIPAMLFFANGEATVGLGDDVQEAQAGTWVHMPANLKHSIKAKTPVVMLLILLK